MNNTPNNLSTFRILFLIKGILTLCFSLVFLIYAGIGAAFSKIPELTNNADSMPFNPGNIFLYIGIAGFVITVVLGTLTIIAANYIDKQKNYTFIFVLALVNAITGVLGILLAIFTLIEITKPEVKALLGKK
jgi:divalent metal cation (Fe/Co/Zn/Cd) transporter